MKQINNFIEKNIEKIIILFLFLQPILDVTTGICMYHFNINLTFSSIIRLLFLLFCIYYLIVLDKTKNKKKNIKILGLILIYSLIYSINIFVYKDIHAFSYEIKSLINTFYFPIVLISFIDIFKQFKMKFNLNYIVFIYIIYLVFVLIPDITNTGFETYHTSKKGTTGWFSSANALGNILSILLPYIYLYIVKAKTNKFIKLIISILAIYILFNLGTKVPICSLLLFVLITFIYYLINWFKNKEYKKIVICLLTSFIAVISFIVILPKTSFYINLEKHKKYLKLDHYYEIVSDFEYVDSFFFNKRLTFVKWTHENYKKASIMEKIFGIGYIANYGKLDENNKLIEIDYFEIFYRHGLVGFILYFSIIFISLKEIVEKLKNRNLTNMMFIISFILIFLLALFSGHMFVIPYVSIFVALIFTIVLNGLYYENKKI